MAASLLILSELLNPFGDRIRVPHPKHQRPRPIRSELTSQDLLQFHTPRPRSLDFGPGTLHFELSFRETIQESLAARRTTNASPLRGPLSRRCAAAFPVVMPCS